VTWIYLSRFSHASQRTDNNIPVVYEGFFQNVIPGTVFVEVIFGLVENDEVYAYRGVGRVNGEACHDFIDAALGLDI
jgi:hypothetical protein